MAAPSSEREPQPQATAWTPQARPVWLVVALSVVTFGLYTTVWFGLSWAELRRERGDTRMHPIWHAIGFALPIYGWFRTLAHFRLLGSMLRTTGSSRVVLPWAAFAASALADVLVVSTYLPASDEVRFIRSMSAAVLLAGLAGEGQSVLNDYWRASHGNVPVRLYGAELLVLALGAVLLSAIVAATLNGVPAPGGLP